MSGAELFQQYLKFRAKYAMKQAVIFLKESAKLGYEPAYAELCICSAYYTQLSSTERNNYYMYADRSKDQFTLTIMDNWGRNIAILKQNNHYKSHFNNYMDTRKQKHLDLGIQAGCDECIRNKMRFIGPYEYNDYFYLFTLWKKLMDPTTKASGFFRGSFNNIRATMIYYEDLQDKIVMILYQMKQNRLPNEWNWLPKDIVKYILRMIWRTKIKKC